MNHRTSKVVIRHGAIAGMFFSLSIFSPPGAAITLEELAAKVERLEAENRALKEQVGKLASSQAATQPAAAAGQAATAASPPAPATGGVGNGVTFNSRHTYQMLDPTTYINRKHLLLLEGRKSGELAENSFTLGGAITSALGRLALAWVSLRFRKRFAKGKSASDLDELGRFLNAHSRYLGPAVFTYALSPLPTNNLFIAAGMAGVNMTVVVIAFIASRMIANTFWVWTTNWAGAQRTRRTRT